MPVKTWGQLWGIDKTTPMIIELEIILRLHSQHANQGLIATRKAYL